MNIGKGFDDLFDVLIGLFIVCLIWIYNLNWKALFS